VLAANPQEVFITEGELDACALVEAGVPADRVLSVPNGAKERASDDPKAVTGYGYVEDALKAGLSRVKKFVWCGDADGNGHALRADMVRLLGAARFWFVDWPEGCKDANDLLKSDGPDALLDRIQDGALPWPVEGLYRLHELPEPAPLQLWSPGFPEWESKVMLAPRTLSVVTGHPGHGKTALWGQIWFQIVKQYGVQACVASFETRPKPICAGNCALCF
jgi:twinkle protein